MLVGTEVLVVPELLVSGELRTKSFPPFQDCLVLRILDLEMSDCLSLTLTAQSES